MRDPAEFIRAMPCGEARAVQSKGPNAERCARLFHRRIIDHLIEQGTRHEFTIALHQFEGTWTVLGKCHH